jgi:[ribosomal protein S18]-alanine N-acetyltransferase
LFQPEDFAALYAIEQVCFPPPDQFSRTYMRQLIRQPSSATWIAEEGEKMVGFGLVEWTRNEAGVQAYVQTLEVLPEVRGRGVGAALLGRLEGSVRQADARFIWLHVDAENAGAIRVYEKHAYQAQGTEPDYYGPGRAAVIYRKTIPLPPGSKVE